MDYYGNHDFIRHSSTPATALSRRIHCCFLYRIVFGSHGYRSTFYLEVEGSELRTRIMHPKKSCLKSIVSLLLILNRTSLIYPVNELTIAQQYGLNRIIQCILWHCSLPRSRLHLPFPENLSQCQPVYRRESKQSIDTRTEIRELGSCHYHITRRHGEHDGNSYLYREVCSLLFKEMPESPTSYRKRRLARRTHVDFKRRALCT